jgi:Protein of unknown function (DUF1580)
MPDNAPFKSLADFISLTAASREVASHPSPATIWRWYRHGVRGVRLQTWCLGTRRYTTRAALDAFIAGVTAASERQPVEDASVERDEATRRQLAAAGVL